MNRSPTSHYAEKVIDMPRSRNFGNETESKSTFPLAGPVFADIESIEMMVDGS